MGGAEDGAEGVVKVKGVCNPHITLKVAIYAAPLAAIQNGGLHFREFWY
jgi:aconitase B